MSSANRRESKITHVSGEEWRHEGLAIVIVGASGDLAKKKTYPSLLSLYADALIPSDVFVYGYARSKMSNEQLRDKLRPYLIEMQEESVVEHFLSRCFYQSGSGYGDLESWKELDIKLIDHEKESAVRKKKHNRLFYFAIPPNVFAETGGCNQVYVYGQKWIQPYDCRETFWEGSRKLQRNTQKSRGTF